MNTKKSSVYIKNTLTDNVVVIVFFILCVGGFFAAGISLPFFVNDLISRIVRNMFIVLALIIPVIAGMGLNFAVVLGAMGAQFALIMATYWEWGGFSGIMLTILLSLPLNICFGYLTGKLFNRSKGKEMISGLILGFFALGVYMFILLVLVGPVIPMDNPDMVLSSGIGLRVSIDIMDLRYGLDNILKIKLSQFALIASAVFLAVYLYQLIKKGNKKKVRGIVISALVAVWGLIELFSPSITGNQRVPVVSFGFIGLLCLFTVFIFRTKLGQDFKAVGQDQHISLVSGISVDRVRLIAIVLSTVFAGIGQIMFIQNMGVFSTYGAHEQAGLFAVASILVGGATVAKATIVHAVVGTILFHSLFIISPLAAQTLFGNAQVGEYFRVFLAYAVIGAALAMYAWKLQAVTKRELEESSA